MLAAVCVAAGVLAALQSVQAPVPSTSVVTAAQEVASGQVIESDDVAMRDFPSDLVPDGSLSDPQDVIGHAASGAIGVGEAITMHRMADQRDTAGLPDGTVLAAVRLEDAAQGSGLQPGDLVNVVATDPQKRSGEIVVRAAPVVTITDADDSGFSQRVLHVGVDEEVAISLAALSGIASLSVVIVPR